MLRLSASRIARAALTLACVFIAVFIAVRLTPGGPAVAMLGQRASPEAVARLNERFGWDQPIPTQLANYAWNLARGDLGVAYLSPGRPPVAAELARRFPATIELGVAALTLATGLGLALGILAALYRDRWPDRLAVALASVGVSIPVFFLGILLLVAFPSMPGSGRLDARTDAAGVERTGFLLVDTILAGRWDLFAMAARHLVLPAVALATIPTAIITRVTRSSLLEVLSADYIRAARAKGAGPARVLVRHALPAALVPILSLLGMQGATLMAGAVLTESVFSWPGLGRYVTEAALRKDYNALQGAVLLLSVVFVAINFATDLLCAYFDPRIRLGGGTRA